MLNNPDLQLSATINCWIAAILLFSFTLKHVPGNNFLPDSLSRCPRAPEDTEKEDDFEEWIDDACRLYVADAFAEFEDPVATPTIFEQDEQVELTEQKLREVKFFLKNAKPPADMRLLPGQTHSAIRERKLKAFIRYTARFFLRNQQLM
ncbi:DNA RNA polymerase [Pyrrhoderma noxium]|uniref:DNA RNA polymerase n=1 Tax=Pyrrhoderma noxium TaxID=2282107 RepID=A0A286UDF7_9AGAM|nr:DNA RNA polymerase [Pyrrhoderma noxium]